MVASDLHLHCLLKPVCPNTQSKYSIKKNTDENLFFFFFDLVFYSPVNTGMVILSWPVNLHTFFLGRPSALYD